MKINWKAIPQATAVIGTIIAALSLMSGLYLYQAQQRDAYIAELRQFLTKTQSQIHHLDSLINYEITHEMVETVIYSRGMEVPLQRVYDLGFNQQASKKRLQSYLNEEFPDPTIPICSPLITAFESILADLEMTSSTYSFDYPGLYRVCKGTRTMIRNIHEHNKRIIRKKDLWALIVPLVAEEENDNIHSIDEFKFELTEYLVSLVLLKLKGDQSDINDLISVVDMVFLAYLSEPTKELVSLRKKVRTQNLKPLNETETITEDLREAEKCLQFVLTQNQLLDYREVITRIEQRNKEDNDSGSNN